MGKEARAFQSPLEVKTPAGCEQWRDMYPYYFVFSGDTEKEDAEKFWFHDPLHWPEPMTPFESLGVEMVTTTLSQYNSRVFHVPPSLGVDMRLLHGYVYVSPSSIADEEQIHKRVPTFMKRAGHYFDNWPEISEKWVGKVEGLAREAEKIQFTDLPDIEDETMVTEARGYCAGHKLMDDYNRLIVMVDKAWNYHFELLNLAYAAHLTLVDHSKKLFPDITNQIISQMVSGFDVALFRPDDELKKLAKLAISLGVSHEFAQSLTPEQMLSRLEGYEQGRRWLAELEQSKHPWFYMNTAPHPGFYYRYKSWMDDLTVPFMAITNYIGKLKAGEEVDRPLKKLKEDRDRILEDYCGLLTTDEDKAGFRQLIGLNRKVFPSTENHLFYVDNWFMSVFWQKIEQLGKLFVKREFFENPEDILFLHRFEVNYALYDMYLSWAMTTPGRGPKYWPEVVGKRKEIFEKFREWSPPPVLGKAPEVITDPIAITLWGISSETIDRMASSAENPDMVSEIVGHAASPGTAEGLARVILSPTNLRELQQGEILVCPATSPSWAPIFGQIRGLVTDAGGSMSHAAIVAREYGLPAVVGTNGATRLIKTGDKLKVDGEAGKVTIIRE